MSFLFIPILLCTSSGAHTPHDNVHAIATADLSSGIRQTLMSTRSHGRVLRSEDNGMSWHAVRGDGLERARADRIVWDSHPDGQRFLIGTNRGVWAYDPVTNTTTELNDGMGPGTYRYVTDMEVAAVGFDGPVLAVSVKGQVYSLDRVANTWSVLLDTGNSDDRGQLAMYPNFNAAGSAGPEQAIAAAVGGVLYQSEDAGVTWSVNPEFDSAAVLPSDPLITALSIAYDYPVSGDLMVATAVENLANFSLDEGTLWHSSDFGATFATVVQTDSSFRRIEATPQGPSGTAWFLAAVLAHPDFKDLPNSDGIFRSSDGGATWSDFGSAQDFIAEQDASWSVSANRAQVMDFAISPTYANDGQILFGRTEGLFESKDEGLHWTRRPYRHVLQTRALGSFKDQQGGVWVATGTYGSGTIVHNLTNGGVVLLDRGSIPYQDDLIVSPQFAYDGTIMAAGLGGENFWFNPQLQAPNPFGKWDWVKVPGSVLLGYARSAAFSPNFDGRGTAGSDQTIFFTTSSHAASNFRSTDGGLSVEFLNKMVDGTPVQYLKHIKVAPTYDANTPAGRTDVYASFGPELFRLHDLRWRHVTTMPSDIESIAIATNFDRDDQTPGRPVLFIGMAKYPYFAALEDRVGNPGMITYPDGLEQGAVESIACPPDFATRPMVYLATYSDGIKKLDFSQQVPVWENVGGVYPDLFVDTMTLSADFANDRTLLVGTQFGLVVGVDDPLIDWELRPSLFSRDEGTPTFRYYQPNNPANPQPDRPWMWDFRSVIQLREVTNLVFRGDSVALTETDGSYILFTDYAKGVQIQTFKGPQMGTANVTITNVLTGAVVDTRTVDLNGQVWNNQTLSFSFPYQPVDVRMEVSLDAGELFYFDAATFVQAN